MKTYINKLKLEKKIIIIHPGDIVVSTSKENAVISTLLGSCVAVCLRDETKGICGMNHFLLPGQDKINDFQSNAAGRYGISSMENLINRMLRRGASKSKITAKIFGGGNIISHFSTNIGLKNVEFVKWFLESEKIPIIGKDVSGIIARKIYFFTKDGTVLVENITKTGKKEVIKEEENYFERAKKLLGKDDVTIF